MSFEYTPADFAEWQQAHAQFMARKSSAAPATSRIGKVVRNVLGWFLFVTLAVVLLFLLSNGKHPPDRADTPAPSYNALAVILPLWLPMLLIMAWFGHLSRKSSRGVPFYELPPSGQKSVPSLLFVWLPLLLAAALSVAWSLAPSTPNWTPSAATLALAAAIPYVVCVVFLVITSKFLWPPNRFLGHEGHSMRGPRTLEEIPGGLRFSTPRITWEVYWPYLVSYLETPNLLALYSSDLTTYLVPKRAFPDAESFDLFCALIQSHVPKGRFLPRLAAFPVVQPRPVLMIPTPSPDDQFSSTASITVVE